MSPFELYLSILCHEHVRMMTRGKSVGGATYVVGMSNQDHNEPTIIEEIMSDPVGYLAEFGIGAEVVTGTSLAAAA